MNGVSLEIVLLGRKALGVRRLIPELRAFALAVLMANIAACDHSAEQQRVDVEEVIADGRSFNGRQLVVQGCLYANPHGLTLASCPSGSLRLVVLASDAIPPDLWSMLYTKASTSNIQHRRSLAVTLCGTYRQTPDGRDRWLDVDDFAIDGDQENASACAR